MENPVKIPLLKQLWQVICLRVELGTVADHIEKVPLNFTKPKWCWSNHESVYWILQVYIYICQLLTRIFFNKHFTLRLLCFFSSGRESSPIFSGPLDHRLPLECRFPAREMCFLFMKFHGSNDEIDAEAWFCDPKNSSFGNVFLPWNFIKFNI